MVWRLSRSSSRPLCGRIEALSNASRPVRQRLDTAPGGPYSTSGPTCTASYAEREADGSRVGGGFPWLAGRRHTDDLVGGLASPPRSADQSRGLFPQRVHVLRREPRLDTEPVTLRDPFPERRRDQHPGPLLATEQACERLRV